MIYTGFEGEREGRREGENFVFDLSLPPSLTLSLKPGETFSQKESDESGGNFQYANKDTTTSDFWVEKMGFGRGEVIFGDVLNKIMGLRDTHDTSCTS